MGETIDELKKFFHKFLPQNIFTFICKWITINNLIETKWIILIYI